MCLKDDAKSPQQPEVKDGVTTTEATGGNSSSQLKTMTPEVQAEIQVPLVPPPSAQEVQLVFLVRDLSTSNVTLPKHPLYLPSTATVGTLLSEVSKIFKYELNSFSLIFQRAAGGAEQNSVHVTPITIEEQLEIHDLDHDKCIMDLNFDVGPNNRNNLIICDLNGYPPRKSDDDDLSLGASASPTSSMDKIWYAAPRTEPTNQESSTETNCAAAARAKRESVGYVGLVNQAMTCYLNSLLQTLFMTPEFRNALYRWEFKGTDEEAAKSIPFQLQRLFLQLQIAPKSAVETTHLTKSFGWDSSEVWQQHDIQELYRVMFDALEQCFKNTDQSELINDLYEGKMKDYVKCLACSTENAREDSFLDIPLPIRPFGSSSAYKSVEEALRAFVEPEILTESNKYECSKCKALCDAHKGLKFTRFPYLLTLHLKRFDFDYQTFHRIKLNDKVTFPNLLDLNGFIDEDAAPKLDIPQAGSPDKCSTDKHDDASTTDSGSALEEENSSADFASSAHTPNDSCIQDEDEGIDVSSICNEKNKQCFLNGPYVYELFSIMIHSGSASGGHYYAYIKDFQTEEWFCFNDQTVSRITYDDIRKTYGGANSRGYYSSWSSSANAYMLMYRKADKIRNVEIFSREEFPPHIKDLVQRMVTEEAAEREAKEIERLMCKVNLFFQHPTLGTLLEKKFKIHKDTTLRETTKLAYQELSLEKLVPLERCRLVKYEEVHDNIECSFVDQDDEPISEVLGGVRSAYKFDLFMEIRDADKEFEEYKPGGTTVKVFIVNLATEEVEGPHIIRASQNMTVMQFKELIGRKLSMDATKLRIVQERYYNELKPLSTDSKLLKDEGFYRSNKVYIEASGEEATNFFNGSQMYSILDRYEHTITLHCNLPDSSKETLETLQIPPYVEPEQLVCKQELPKDITTQSIYQCPISKDSSEVTSLSTATTVTSSLCGSVGVSSPIPIMSCPPPSPLATHEIPRKASPKPSTQSLNLCGMPCNSTISLNTTTTTTPTPTPTSCISTLNDLPSSRSSSSSIIVQENLSDGEDEGIVDMDRVAGSSSAVNSDQSASEDSSLTSDSDRTLVGEPPDKLSDGSHSPDYHNVSSPEDNHNEKDKSIVSCWDPNEPGWSYEDDKEDVKRYFRAQLAENNVLRITVDKRITIGQLKKELQKYVKVSQEHFKLYKFYTNSSQEFECTRMTETLSSYGDYTVMKVTLGRALLPGEFKGKVFLLDPTNSEEPAKILIDFVISQGDTILNVKNAVVKEVNSKCEMNLIPDKVRLRKKSWKNPQTIYLNNQIFGDDITIYQNWELYLQTIEKEEKTGNSEELSLFFKKWSPSTYSTEPLVEYIIKKPTTEALKLKISEVSNISIANVEFAKGKGTFPCDMSVLDIPNDLDWIQKTGDLDQKPLYIMDDGAVIYYRDKSESLKLLTEAEKNELNTEEATRLKKEIPYSAPASSNSSNVHSSRTRERGLKIYLNQPSQ